MESAMTFLLDVALLIGVYTVVFALGYSVVLMIRETWWNKWK